MFLQTYIKSVKIKDIIATTQLNSTQSWVSLIFLCKTKPQTTKPKPYPTLSQLLHNQTRTNSVCNLNSTQLKDASKKNWFI